LAALCAAEPATSVVLLCEVNAETRHMPHHRRKIAFVLSAMRHFAARLCSAGWTVDWVTPDDPDNTASFCSEVARVLARHCCRRVLTTEGFE
jgi:deoxyribodipyrimidine photolyase-related protein